MLRTRVITALVLLGLLVALLVANSSPVIALAVGIFMSVSIWEALRLFKVDRPVLVALAWAILYAMIVYKGFFDQPASLMALCILIWILRLAPSLKIGLPILGGLGNSLLAGVYCLAILGSFVAMLTLFSHSALYLFSVLALVWIADIGAYFSGKALGKRKLAPSISPGKSWEGAIGGWISVLLLASVSTQITSLQDTFVANLLRSHGWLLTLAALSMIVAASVVGDLFESQLKRRAGVKDSSAMLPGHGGILDRIDALVPVLPLAVILDIWR